MHTVANCLLKKKKKKKKKKIRFKVDIQRNHWPKYWFRGTAWAAKDPDEIAEGWCGYFTNLYKFTRDSSFDEPFRQFVDKNINRIIGSDDTDDSQIPSLLTGNLSLAELNAAIKSLPLDKAPSRDNITYEHIIYGGKTLKQCLFELFDILVSGNIPVKFKQGLIITLHKGAGKSYTNPDDYRAISLLPSIAKLFEKLLLNRLENFVISKSIHPLQYGFQKRKK